MAAAWSHTQLNKAWVWQRWEVERAVTQESALGGGSGSERMIRVGARSRLRDSVLREADSGTKGDVANFTGAEDAEV